MILVGSWNLFSQWNWQSLQIFGSWAHHQQKIVKTATIVLFFWCDRKGRIDAEWQCINIYNVVSLLKISTARWSYKQYSALRSGLEFHQGLKKNGKTAPHLNQLLVSKVTWKLCKQQSKHEINHPNNPAYCHIHQSPNHHPIPFCNLVNLSFALHIPRAFSFISIKSIYTLVPLLFLLRST